MAEFVSKSDDLPPCFDLFVKTYADKPEPIGTITVKRETTLEDLQKFTMSTTSFKSIERIQIWIHGKKAVDPTATVE